MTIHLTLSPAPAAPPRSPTRRACAVAASLGLFLDDLAPNAGAAPIPLALAPNAIALLRGPSGSGKSSLLAHARRQLGKLGTRAVSPPARLRNRPTIDLIGGPLEYATGALARAGLAEAACFVRRPCELSEGQRERLRLAIAMESARRASKSPPGQVVLLLDEFCAGLDRLHARAVAALLRRWISRSPQALCAIIATPRDDLEPWLAPDATITCSLSGPPSISVARAGASPADPLDAISIEPGVREDYFTLAPLHYRAHHPATIARVLRAVHHEHPDVSPVLAGALVVSMPALNARWRDLAWPGRYDSADKARSAHRLNEELRTITRVIIDPRFRSLGLAARMVGHYLDNPLTPSTEAVAAMGGAAPFFERAGMTPYLFAPSRRDARLLDALTLLGLEPWRLAAPSSALRRAIDSAPGAARLLDRELRAWADASRATRSLADSELPAIFRVAARSLACSATAYAHTRPT